VTTPRSSRFSAPHLVRRQLAADRGSSVLVAVTVLLVALVLTAAPRFISGLFGADLRDQVGGLSAAQRDPNASVMWAFPRDLVGEVDAGEAVTDLAAQLAETREEQSGDTLRSVLDPGVYALTRPRALLGKGDDAPDITAMNVLVRVDPAIGERVSVVEGERPGEVAPELVAAAVSGLSMQTEGLPPMPVMAAADTADWLRWRVGEERDIGGLAPAVLVGVFEPVDPEAGYWSHLESTVRPVVDQDGNLGTTVTGVLYTDPSALPMLAVPNGMVLDSWFPVDVDAVADVDRAELAAQLSGFLAGSETSSELPGTLERALGRQAMVNTLLSALTVGPTAAALGVLWLAGLLGLERRRPALVTARARGATRPQLRVVLAGQGLLVGIPAAAAGALIGTAAVRAPGRVTDYLLPCVVGLAPGVLMAVAGGQVSVRPERADLGSGRRRAVRWVAEGAVVVLAVLSALGVRQRGLAGSAVGLDPVLLACPVLIALAVSVVVMRLYPLPMRSLARSLHGSRRLPNFLGAAATGRSPVAGAAPVVALALGVAGTLLCVVALSTVRIGVAENAAQIVGADLRVDRAAMTDAEVAAVRALEGVTEVAVVGDVGPVAVVAGDTTVTVDATTVDVDAVVAVQSGLAGVDLPPAALGDASAAADADGMPVMVAADVAVDDDRAVTLLVSGSEEVPARIVARGSGVAGVTSGGDWLVVDAETLATSTGAEPQVDRLLIRLDGATSAAVARDLESILGPIRTMTPEGAASSLRSAVLVGDTQVGLVALTALSTLLCAGIVALVLAGGAPGRGRMSALLTTLGAPRGTRRRLVLWDVVPITVVGVAAGLCVGGVLPWLVLGPADLRPFTGGVNQPALTLDAAVAAVVAAGALIATAAAVAYANMRAGRTRAVTVLREGAGS
jgi:putative ABC transport system permease protein